MNTPRNTPISENEFHDTLVNPICDNAPTLVRSARHQQVHKSGRLLHELVYRKAAAAHLVRGGVRAEVRVVGLGRRLGLELGLLIEVGLWLWLG